MRIGRITKTTSAGTLVAPARLSNAPVSVRHQVLQEEELLARRLMMPCKRLMCTVAAGLSGGKKTEFSRMVFPLQAGGGGVSEADVSGEIAAWIELAPKARPAQRRDRLLVLRFVVLRFGGRRVALMGGVVGPPGRRVLIRRTRRISHPRPHSQLAQPRF